MTFWLDGLDGRLALASTALMDRTSHPILGGSTARLTCCPREPGLTIDKSLRVKAGAIQNRNVLTRAERVEKLKEAERWREGDSVLGLPKVRVLKLALKKKKKAAK